MTKNGKKSVSVLITFIMVLVLVLSVFPFNALAASIGEIFLKMEILKMVLIIGAMNLETHTQLIPPPPIVETTPVKQIEVYLSFAIRT